MTGYDSNRYSYKIIEDAGSNPKLLQEVIVSPHLNLYMESDKQLVSKTRTTQSIRLGKTKVNFQQNYLEPSLIPVWYVGKNNSSFVEPLPEDRTAVMKRYNECQAVILKYRSIADDDFFIPEFVRFYNENCQ